MRLRRHEIGVRIVGSGQEQAFLAAWLSDRVEAAFGFLVTEYDFLGPEAHDQGLRYYSPLVSIEIVYDERAQDVEALACRVVGDSYIRARVGCLAAIVSGPLGPGLRLLTRLWGRRRLANRTAGL